MKKTISIALALVLAFSFVSCENKDNKKSTEKEKVSIVLDWYPNAIHAFLYNAIELGYFEEENLELDIHFPSNTNDGIVMPATGKVDFGIFYLLETIRAKAKEDIPAVSLGPILNSTMNVVVSLKENNITKPKDLEGKTIGYAGTDLSKNTIIKMMESSGADSSKVKFIDVGFELLSALTTKKVDATTDNMLNHEVPFMQEQGLDVNYFKPTEYGIPDYYGMIILTGKDNIKNNKDKVDRFIRAIKKGFDYMRNNKEESLDILFKYQNKENFPLNREVERKSLDILLESMPKSKEEFLLQDKDAWVESVNWLKTLGILEKDFDPSELLYEGTRKK